MKTNLYNIIKGCGFALFAVLFLFSCVNDDDFDVPVFTGEIEEVFGGGGATPVFQSCFKEDFESYAEETTEFASYENVATLGASLWEVDEFSSNKYLVLSAFRANSFVYSYFAFPVDFDTADLLRFKTQDRFNNGDVLKVFYSTEYNVNDNIAEANLTEITGSFSIANGTTGGSSQPFVNSGSYDLSSISGQGYIIFKYEGDGIGATTSMHIDDIELFDTDMADCTPQDPCATENFESFTDGDTNLMDYQIVGTDGTWEIDNFSNNYLRMSAFNYTGPQDTWFIMGVNFDDAEEMNFSTQEAFDNGSVLSVMTSTDYDEMGDPSTATWTDITSNFTIASGNSGGFGSFVNSGSHAFGMTGMGYVAFRYQGEAGMTDTRMHIDNINLTNFGGAGACTFALPDPIPPFTGEVRANEFHYDNTGSDMNEFVEVRLEGDMSAQPGNLGDYRVVFYNGSDSNMYTDGDLDASSIKLSDGTQTCDASYCYYVVERSMQNGAPDGFAVVGPNGVVEFFSYEGVITANDGPAQGMTSVDVGVEELGTQSLDSSIQRNAAGDMWEVTDGTNTKGAANASGGTGLSDLIISEYAEGSSFNKYIELYNGTGADVDLSSYEVWRISNGGTWPEFNVQLSGILADGATYVICNTGSDATIIAAADLQDNTIANFNGDDAMGLAKNDGSGTFVLIDAVGTDGADPGSGWDVDGTTNATANHTLVRKSGLTGPNTDWAASSAAEWNVLANDDWTNIDMHTP